jgi:uncharacterized protein involved in exopolysaccharide biosynthesis
VRSNRDVAVFERPPESDESDQSLEGPGLIGSLWRYRRVLVIAAVVGAVAGLAASYAVPATYEARARLFVRDPGIPGVLSLDRSSGTGDHSVFLATQAAIAGSDVVLGRAATVLHRGSSPEELGASVAVAPSADLSALQIDTTAGRPGEAADVANAVGLAYQQVMSEHTAADADAALARMRQVRGARENELDKLRARIAATSGAEAASLERQSLHVANLIGDLQVQESQIAAQAAFYGSGVEMFQRASAPTSSTAP